MQVKRLYVVDDASPPALQLLTVSQLNDVDLTGRFIRTEGLVTRIGQNMGGDLMELSDGGASILVFHPFEGPERLHVFTRFRVGDRVAVKGISGQYCPAPPFNRSFEIVIGSTGAVEVVSRAWIVPPQVAGVLLLLLIAALGGWFWRERKLKRQRRRQSAIVTLGEDIIGAANLAEIARLIENVPPENIGGAQIELYVVSETAHELQRVRTERNRLPVGIPISQADASLSSLVARCFRERRILVFPNLRRLEQLDDQSSLLPSSAIVAPMTARGEAAGVMLLLYRKRRRDFSQDYQLAIQHLANQAAAALRLQDQQIIKEQLLRSEKMAAAGQLVAGVAADLRAPLSRIEARCQRLLTSPGTDPGLAEVSKEARRALEIVDYLLLFSTMEKRAPKPVDVNGALRALLDRRSEEQDRLRIRVEHSTPASAMEVWADEAQIEHALLTAIMHAESTASASKDRTLRVTSRISGSRVHVVLETGAVTYGIDARVGSPDITDYFGFPVAQAIVQSHGGDLRKVIDDKRGGIVRFELELPAHTAHAGLDESSMSTRGLTRVMTALIVETDQITQRQLLVLLAERGHRAIPVTMADEALDLVQRISFDLVFCSTRVTGLTWLELFARIRRKVGTFALLTDGYDPESPAAFSDGDGQILPKPVQERDLEKLLGIAEVRWTVAHR